MIVERNRRGFISLYSYKYVTEDICTHVKFLGKWCEKPEESIVSMNSW